MESLKPTQKADILKSLNRIKEDIQNLQNNPDLKDGDLLFFYDELRRKAEFGYNFVKCADLLSRMESGEIINII